jgi:glycerate kinase
MRYLLALDSFKDSLASASVCRAVARGLQRRASSPVVDECPLADGGEGFLACILGASSPSDGWRQVALAATGPLGDPCETRYLVRGTSAVVEMALVAGLEAVPAARRDPARTTAAGLGEVLRHAVAVSGCTSVLLGVGGSATSEGGLSVLAGLGCTIERGAGDTF